MKLATWNVNSLKVRLPHLQDWLASEQPDVVCLQELKCEDSAFPEEAIAATGYQAVWSGQKTYNGVAILSRHPLADVISGNPHFPDEQKRLISARISPPGEPAVRVVSAYFPNGQALDSEKYPYKLAWCKGLLTWLHELRQTEPELVLAGDYNIAPEDRDVHDPVAWAGQILCSDPERQVYRDLLAQGFQDAYRLFEQPEKSFSWWDYRNLGFQKNLGLRIDHILVTPGIAARCTAARVDRAPRKWQRPSDHAPVVVEWRQT